MEATDFNSVKIALYVMKKARSGHPKGVRD